MLWNHELYKKDYIKHYDLRNFGEKSALLRECNLLDTPF
jgi:hypothetical protein